MSKCGIFTKFTIQFCLPYFKEYYKTNKFRFICIYHIAVQFKMQKIKCNFPIAQLQLFTDYKTATMRIRNVTCESVKI